MSLQTAAVQQRMAHLVERLTTARDRRSAGWEGRAGLDGVLAVLSADHVGGPATPVGEPLLDERLEDAAAVFGLTPLDLELLFLACAPDLDPNIGVAYSLLQGDPAKARPGVALALELCEAPLLSAAARARLGPRGPLLRHDLLKAQSDGLFLQRALHVPDRVVAHLLGDDALEPLLASLSVEPVAVPDPAATGLARVIQSGVPLVWIRSRAGSAALGLAVAAYDELRIAHLCLDLTRCPAERLPSAVRSAVREAGLQRAGLVLAGAERLAEPGALELLEVLQDAAVPVAAVSSRGWDPSWLARLPFAVEAPTASPEVRHELWQQRLGFSHDQDDPAWTDLVSLRLTPEEIVQTARYAAVLAASRDEEPSVTMAREAARRLSADLAGKRPSLSPPTFADLVLPSAVLTTLQELVSWSRHRDEVLGQGSLAGKGGKGRGIAALFAGSPGTGKTLAAHVVASELGLDLHTVDLSAVVDKYIGETEKNLERVFDEAESLNVLLFFDEADALFGTRSEVRDARDRYANQEVAYLLQRMEQFDGIAVLATNLEGNLDPAFSRRLHFIVHFPDPDLETRRHLWQVHLAAVVRHDRADPVDVDKLAEGVEMAGGDIRNVVLAAAYAAVAEGAPLGMRHVTHAVVREYRKLGRRLPASGVMTVSG